MLFDKFISPTIDYRSKNKQGKENNMFDNYKQDAFFIGSTISECLHTWSNNYWRDAHFLPVPILGRLRRPLFSIFIINLDKYPAREVTPLK